LTAVEANQDFSEAALAAGVFTPRPRPSVHGTAVADISGTPVRLMEWVDLAPRSRRLDPADVGRTVARLHRAGEPTSERVGNWFATGMGEDAWHDMHRRLLEAAAPFAGELEDLLPDLVAVEQVME